MFQYEISYYNETVERQEEVKGFVCARTLADASDEIAAYYGEDNITSLTLLYVGEDSLIEIPKEIDIVPIKEHNKQ